MFQVFGAEKAEGFDTPIEKHVHNVDLEETAVMKDDLEAAAYFERMEAAMEEDVAARDLTGDRERQAISRRRTLSAEIDVG